MLFIQLLYFQFIHSFIFFFLFRRSLHLTGRECVPLKTGRNFSLARLKNICMGHTIKMEIATIVMNWDIRLQSIDLLADGIYMIYVSIRSVFLRFGTVKKKNIPCYIHGIYLPNCRSFSFKFLFTNILQLVIFVKTEVFERFPFLISFL